MEKRYYKTGELLKNILVDKEMIRGTEGKIYMLLNEVLKVYDVMYEQRNEESMEFISNLDSDLLTVPTSLLYIDDVYYGYYMKNAGVNLATFLCSNQLPLKERVDIAKQMKKIALYLKDKHLAHGDISFSNLFIDDGHVRLGDVNNLITGKSVPRLNLLSRYWYGHYRDYQVVDNLSVNYLTYILLNYPPDDLEWILSDIAMTFIQLNSFFYDENIAFDEKVWEEQKRLLYTDANPYEAVVLQKYLVDYIKKY